VVGVDMGFQQPLHFQTFLLDIRDDRIRRSGIGAPRRVIEIKNGIDHGTDAALRIAHLYRDAGQRDQYVAALRSVLKKYPKCTLIAHAYWWRQLKDADRQLTQHPNLYGDMSGNVVPNVLNRDRKFAREFIIRHQDKLLFGTDEGWWSFGKDPSPFKHYTFFESLDLPDEVRYKIYRGNAEKLFGWEPAKEQ